MAIVQISQIKHRRGRQDDLPQLGSAELGWSVDQRRLYIGNGDLAEGAPEIGNTEIVTAQSITRFVTQTLGGGIPIVRMYIAANSEREIVAINGESFVTPFVTTYGFQVGDSGAPAAPTTWLAYQFRTFNANITQTGNTNSQIASVTSSEYARSGHVEITNINNSGTSNAPLDYCIQDDYSESGTLSPTTACLRFEIYPHPSYANTAAIKFVNAGNHPVELFYYFNTLQYAVPAGQYRDPDIAI